MKVFSVFLNCLIQAFSNAVTGKAPAADEWEDFFIFTNP